MDYLIIVELFIGVSLLLLLFISSQGHTETTENMTGEATIATTNAKATATKATLT